MKILYCNNELIKYHIAEALVMGGLPMSTTTDHLAADIRRVEAAVFGYMVDQDLVGDHIQRGPKLGKAKAGSGHDCFLKGIVVTAVISLPAYVWPQLQRYHFIDIISSQSKMHRITKMDLKAQCNDEVDPWIIDRLNRYVSQYNEATDPAQKHKLFRKILNNTPHGLHLAAGIVTNYLQLKTMKLQRKNHKLEEWSDDFVDWVDSLPYFTEFTGV